MNTITNMNRQYINFKNNDNSRKIAREKWNNYYATKQDKFIKHISISAGIGAGLGTLLGCVITKNKNAKIEALIGGIGGLLGIFISGIFEMDKMAVDYIQDNCTNNNKPVVFNNHH